MKRLSGRFGWAAIVVAIVAIMTQVAEAQRGEGRRGRPGEPRGPGRGFPPSAVRLATMEPVQESLNLSDEQKDKVAAIDDEVRDKARKAFGERRGERGDFGRVLSEMEKLNDEATTKLMEVLDDKQQRQLAAIAVKVNDAGALNDPLVVAELNITDEQQEKLAEVRDSQRREMRESLRDRRPDELSEEERRELREKFEARRAEVHKQMLAVLTSEQQNDFDSLKSEAADIDVSQLRGFGDRGRFEGRRGERERGERGRRGRDRDSEPRSEGADSGT